MEAKAIIGSSRPRIDQTDNQRFGIINFDEDNLYPQRMEVLKSTSGTATRCVNTYARFLKGQGFADNNFFKLKINQDKLTVDALLSKHVSDFALHRGFAFHINYNLAYEPIEWNYVPWSYLRLGSDEENPGKVALYDDWARQKHKKIQSEEIEYIDLFNPDKDVIAQQIQAAGGIDKWKGQILWVSSNAGEYPLSMIDPVIEDVQSDAESKTFRLRSLATNFMPSHMLVTDKAESQAKEQAFVDNLKGFQGSKKSLKILWVQKQNVNQTIDLKKFDIQDTDKMYEITTRTIKDSIIENFGIPSILLNVRVAGELGNDAKKLKDATDFYNALTDDDRKFISDAYQVAFSETTLNATNDFSILPVSVPVTADNIPKEFLPDLTKNERRKLVDAPEEVGAQADKPILATVLGVGGTQAMITILQDSTLSRSQKLSSLKLLFALNDADANSLLPAI